MTKKQYVRVKLVRKDEENFLTLGKLYEVKRIDSEGDFHIIDDEGDDYFIDGPDGELIENKAIVKCTALLYETDYSDFVEGHLYEVVSVLSTGNVQVIDKNGRHDRLLVPRQFEYVYQPAAAEPAAKTEYVRVTRLLPVDKRKNNFTVGKVYEVIGKVDRHVEVIDDKGERMVLASYQIEYVEEPFKKRVRVTRLLSIDKTRKNFKLGHTYEVVEEDISGCHVIVIDEQGERAALISSQYEPIVAARKSSEITLDGKQLASLVFSLKPEEAPVKTKIKVINPTDMDCLVLKKGDVLDVIRETEHSYVVRVNSCGSWHINKERAIEINY